MTRDFTVSLLFNLLLVKVVSQLWRYIFKIENNDNKHGGKMIGNIIDVKDLVDEKGGH